MAKTRELTAIVLAGALALGNAGCIRTNKSEFIEKIGEDQATLVSSRYLFNDESNTLTITKPDGRVITYKGSDINDGAVMWLTISKDGQTTKYDLRIEKNAMFRDEVKKEFDTYVQKIKEQTLAKLK